MNKRTLPVIYKGITGVNHPDGVVERAEKMIIGRTPKINEEKVSIILNALNEGKTVRKACEMAGISKATFYIWKKVNTSFLDAVDRAQENWTDSLVDEGLNDLREVEAKDKNDGVKVRKAECFARHTLEIASRLNPKYSVKQQTTNKNFNINVDIDPVDMEKYR